MTNLGRRSVALVATPAVVLTVFASFAQGAPTGDGALRVVVVGLPPGQAGVAILRGPKGFRRKIRGKALKFRHLAPGRYRLTPKKVQVERASGGILKGATAQPLSSATVRVTAGKTQMAEVAYGSIVNPGVVSLPESGIHAVGARNNPHAVVVPGTRFRIGQILTSGPTAELPGGLVARVTAIKPGNGTETLLLTPVPVTDAAPVIETAGSAPVANQAQTSAVLGLKVEQDIARGCGLSGQTKLTPIVRLEGMSVEADVRATPWGGGPKADLVVSSRTTFGFKLNATGSVYCKKVIAAPEVPFAIPVGPIVIPGYVAMPVTAKISLSGETTTQATYSWSSQIGMRTRHAGPALIPTPVFSASAPSATFSASTNHKIAIEGGVDVEAGLGIHGLASLYVKAGTSLEAAMEPSNCHLDWKLGNLAAGGKVGLLSVGTPDFTGYTKRIWTGCTAGAGSGMGSNGGPTSPSSDMPDYPPSTEHFIQITAGGYRTCGLRPDGTALCWGAGGGSTEVPQAAGTFSQLTSGDEYSCGLRTDDTAACWGFNEYGQASPPGGVFTQLSAGYFSACGLRSDGIAVCWGNGKEDATTPPVEPFGQLASGFDDACGLRTDGNPVCWGWEEWGQTIPPKEQFSQLSGGGELFMCGLRTDGTAACWGYNDKGQANPPTGSFSQLSVGTWSACGLRTSGAAVCWGDNSHGQSDPPAGTFIQLASGRFHTCGLRSSGIAVCWGDNVYGQASPP